MNYSEKYHPTFQNIPKNKNVSLLLTGGLDSTYLYWLNILNGNRVTPIYTNIENNGLRSKVENHNINSIISTVGEISEKYNAKGSTEKLRINKINLDYQGKTLFQQVPIHIISTLMNVDQRYTDSVQIGYCMGDDVIGYLSDVQKIYNSYQSIFDIKLPKLTFPLVKTDKQFMLDELPTELRPLIFSCEYPELTIKDDMGSAIPCGYCTVCKKYSKYTTYGTRLNPAPNFYEKSVGNYERDSYDVLVKDEQLEPLKLETHD